MFVSCSSGFGKTYSSWISLKMACLLQLLVLLFYIELKGTLGSQEILQKEGETVKLLYEFNANGHPCSFRLYFDDTLYYSQRGGGFINTGNYPKDKADRTQVYTKYADGFLSVTVKISSITPTDTGVYLCKFSCDTSGRINKYYSLRVAYPPEPALCHWDTSFLYRVLNDDALLKCNFKEGYPINGTVMCVSKSDTNIRAQFPIVTDVRDNATLATFWFSKSQIYVYCCSTNFVYEKDYESCDDFYYRQSPNLHTPKPSRNVYTTDRESRSSPSSGAILKPMILLVFGGNIIIFIRFIIVLGLPKTRCSRYLFILVFVFSLFRLGSTNLGVIEGENAELVFQFPTEDLSYKLHVRGRDAFFENGQKLESLQYNRKTLDRFQIAITGRDFGSEVNLIITNVSREDGGKYICDAYKNGKLLAELTKRAGLTVNYPPGRPLCKEVTVTHDDEVSKTWDMFECLAPAGTLQGDIVCSQDGDSLPYKCTIQNNDQTIVKQIWAKKGRQFQCCTKTYSEQIRSKKCESFGSKSVKIQSSPSDDVVSKTTESTKVTEPEDKTDNAVKEGECQLFLCKETWIYILIVLALLGFVALAIFTWQVVKTTGKDLKRK